MADAVVICRHLGVQPYAETFTQMRSFSETRQAGTPDEIWFLEHFPVFTQGQAGKPEHVLTPGIIPVVTSNRGGQITYHGPGQLVAYTLLDLQRRGMGIRQLITLLERTLVTLLAGYGICAFPKPQAPGVYVERDFGAGMETRKIGSIGLRVTRGCSYHGLSLNVAMDLEPFSRINPCGYPGLRMTQLSELGGPKDLKRVAGDLAGTLEAMLGTNPIAA